MSSVALNGLVTKQSDFRFITLLLQPPLHCHIQSLLHLYLLQKINSKWRWKTAMWGWKYIPTML